MKCSAHCKKCASKLECEECELPYSLTSDKLCKCSQGFKNKFNECIVCGNSGYFYNQELEICQKCDYKCKSCLSPDGKCTECISNFVLNSEGVCTCPVGSFDRSYACFEARR